jgi:hypothetical protein
MSNEIPLTQKSKGFGDHCRYRQYMGNELYVKVISMGNLRLRVADSRVGSSE